MASDSIYKGISHVVQINTNIDRGCEHCSFRPKSDELASYINHYIEEHEYKLLHIGTETSRDYAEEITHNSIAFLGK